MKKASKAMLLAVLLLGLLLLCACDEQTASVPEPPASSSEPTASPTAEPVPDTAQTEKKWEKLYSYGTMYWDGDPEMALPYFEEAIEVDPTRPEPYDMVARYYLVYEGLDRALNILEQGIEATNDSALEAQLDQYKNWWAEGDWYDTLLTWDEVAVNGVPFTALTAEDLASACGANQSSDPENYKSSNDAIGFFITRGSFGRFYPDDVDVSQLPESSRSLVVSGDYGSVPVDINGVTIGISWNDALSRMGFSQSAIPDPDTVSPVDDNSYSAVDAYGMQQTAYIGAIPGDGKMHLSLEVSFFGTPDWLNGRPYGSQQGWIKFEFKDGVVTQMRIEAYSDD